MIALLQRVRSARVEVDGQAVGAIGPGLLVLVCAERGDTPDEGDRLLTKILKLILLVLPPNYCNMQKRMPVKHLLWPQKRLFCIK